MRQDSKSPPRRSRCTPARQAAKVKIEYLMAASEVWVFGGNGRFHFLPTAAVFRQFEFA